MLTVYQSRPDPRLQALVRNYVQRETPSTFIPGAIEPFVARLGVVLDFMFASQYEIPIRGTNDFDTCMPLALVGPQTHSRAQLVVRGRIEELVVLFHPQGFYKLFREPTISLVDRATEAQAVLGSSMILLYEQLGNTADFHQRTRILDAFLLKRLQCSLPSDLLSRVFDALVAQTRPMTVAEWARQAGLSVRQLERKSLLHTGLTPKTLSRIARFQRALLAKRTTNAKWTSIAHTLEYYDQMHMVHDFRMLAGDTPGRIIKQIGSDHLICLP